MEREIRQSLVEASQTLVRLELNHGTAGNISVRYDGAMMITPSGVSAHDIEPGMMASMTLDTDGHWVGTHAPSSEWRLHRDILVARSDVGAVVHTHSTYATILATQHRSIPALHYMIAAFGGAEIRCTPYAPYGTQDLSDLILDSLGERHAVLLGNHGMVTVGATLEIAMWRASELENLAQMYLLASATGTPVILSDDEIAATIDRFSGYGMSRTR